MDISRIASSFFTADGQLNIDEKVTIPALSEMLFALDGSDEDRNQPAITGWSFGSDPSGVADTLTRGQVNTRIKAVAARLGQVGEPGTRVAILASNGPAYIYGFLGALYAGMTPIPLYDPDEPGHADHLAAVLADAKPGIVLTATSNAASVRRHFGGVPASRRPRIIVIDALPDSLAESFTPPQQPAASSPAFIQYTSGSTRTPAGVVISHEAVVANALQIYRAVSFLTPSRMVMWLPLHHDMGIILAVVFAVLGYHLEIFSPRDFVQHPDRWITLLSRKSPGEHVYTAVPNFALEMAAAAGVPADGQDLDLSAVEAVFVGSEPTTEHAVDSFVKAFGPLGITRRKLRPGYGLAEATLLVTVTQKQEGIRIVHTTREALGAGRVDECPAGAEDGVALISCGQVVQPQDVIIVDPETHEKLPDGHIGEIWCRGVNLASGYLDRPEDTAATFGRSLPSDGSGGWMATGDLAVVLDGDVFITGRLKDLIVIAGRNHYPQDIEFTACAATSHVAPGAAAAFSVPGTDSEKLVVLAERATDADPAGDEDARGAIRAAVTSHHGVTPTVIVVEPGGIKRSSSGKIARRVNRAAYLAETSN